MRVSYVQPIFAPNEEMTVRNLTSLKSFFDYYESHNYNFKCVFGGYSSDDANWYRIVDYILLRNKQAIIYRFDKNYGKAHVVNHLVSAFLDSETYFLTADSDIIYKMDEPDIILRLTEGFNEAHRLNLNPALISLFQEVNNCQMLDLCYENKYYYHGKYNFEMFCHPNGVGGVAGGCLFISKKFWDLVGGYRVLGVYAGDDANLMQDAYNNGFKFLMSNSIRCIHPNETMPAYREWKIKVCPTVQQLEVAVDDANNFWKSRG